MQLILNDLKGKIEENFIYLLKLFKRNPERKHLFFKFISLNLKKIKSIKNKKEYLQKEKYLNALLKRYSEILLDLDESTTIKVVCKLSFENIYDFLLFLKPYHEKSKFHLLQFLENNNQTHLIKDKILFFGLICKFKPQKAKEHAELLNISEYTRCLEIAEKEKCWPVVAFIKFKQGKFENAFKIYSLL